jgi:hypothetical protein
MNWRENFLSQRKGKTIADLRKETEIKKVEMELSKKLRSQTTKERQKKIRKEISEMIRKIKC